MDEVATDALRAIERSLPATWYYATEHHAHELERIWYRNWIYVGRAEAIAEPLDYLTHRIGTQVVLVLRDEHGELRAFHNTCRHRGATLCSEASGRLVARRITCRYHGWSYTLQGELARVPHHDRPPPPGLERDALGLYPVSVAEWRGFVFVNLDHVEPPSLAESLGPAAGTLARWPLEGLRVGHDQTFTVQCNWKIFWENYNECLHCPGVHPTLSAMVPIYRRGIMEPQDDPGWPQHRDSTDPAHRGGLRAGAVSWSMDGQACGPVFAGLSDPQRRLGYHYLTNLPSMYLVAHVDYVRVVRLRPVAPEATEVTTQWLFAPETLQAPAFNLANTVEFATRFMAEDAEVCELTQRGQHSIAHTAGILLPEEYELGRFHEWVRGELER
jgi:Rieske 2Fe-2S family protein